jgi:hypothetical protein
MKPRPPRMVVLVSPSRDYDTWFREAFYPATVNPRPLERNLFGYMAHLPEYLPVHDEFEEVAL